MTTANITVGRDWVKLADAGQAFLVSGNSDAEAEIAATATNIAPTVEGHKLKFGVGREGLVREVIGQGYVWARIADAKPGMLVVTK